MHTPATWCASPLHDVQWFVYVPTEAYINKYIYHIPRTANREDEDEEASDSEMRASRLVEQDGKSIFMRMMCSSSPGTTSEYSFGSEESAEFI
jgi:hypothetical protein